MAILSKAGIISGSIIQPAHITQIIDALTASGSAIDILITGSVGIGTTTPNSKLNIVGITTIGYPGLNSTSHIQFWPTNAGGSAYYIIDKNNIFNIGVGEYNVSGIDALAVDGLGNVGIGTNAPAAKFEVAGATSPAIGGKIRISNPNTTDYAELQFATGSESKAIIFVNGSTQSGYGGANSFNLWQISNTAPMVFHTGLAATERMRITAAGNTIITGSLTVSNTTTVEGNLVISNSYPRLFLTDTNSNSDYSLINDDGNFTIFDDTNNVPRIYVTSNGNVGINKFAPNATLDVNGDAIVTGSITATSTVTSTNLTVASSTVLSGSTTLFGNAGLLDIKGTDHAYIEWYPNNSTRRAYFGFASSGSNNIILENENTSGSISLVTNNGFVGINKYIPAASLDVNGNALISGSLQVSSNAIVSGSVSVIGTLGYTVGAGGTVIQSTSRTTPVTINKICGTILLVTAAGTTSYTTFQVNNTLVAATDVVIVNARQSTNVYETFVTEVNTNYFKITFRTTGGTASDALFINFAVIKSITT